jgi:hypothetical protein
MRGHLLILGSKPPKYSLRPIKIYGKFVLRVGLTTRTTVEPEGSVRIIPKTTI